MKRQSLDHKIILGSFFKSGLLWFLRMRSLCSWASYLTTAHFLMCEMGLITVSYRVEMGLNEIIHVEAHCWHMLFTQCVLIIAQLSPVTMILT